MNSTDPSTDYPFAIKAVCLIGFINASQMTALINAPMVKQVSALLPAYFIVSVAISLICLVGLWLMKRWAALTFAIVLICNQIALLATGFWEVTALIMPAMMIGLLYSFRGQMR